MPMTAPNFQLRTFVDRSNGGTRGWPAVQMNAVGLSELMQTAAHFAQRCTSALESVVFAPP
jgi:hypothetical protein